MSDTKPLVLTLKQPDDEIRYDHAKQIVEWLIAMLRDHSGDYSKAEWKLSASPESSHFSIQKDGALFWVLKLVDGKMDFEIQDDGIFGLYLQYLIRKAALHSYLDVYVGTLRLSHDPGILLATHFRPGLMPLQGKDIPFEVIFLDLEDFELRADTPTFRMRGFFAQKHGKGPVYLINTSLAVYFQTKKRYEETREFAIQVAEDPEQFARKYDLELIPTDFYTYFFLGSSKIINGTTFDIKHISRKVFVKPFVRDFTRPKSNEIILNNESHMQLMDKVRKDESLDACLKRVLKDELQVADDYVAARIERVEYDRDKEDKLTPRLVVDVYINGLRKHQQERKYDWVSLK